MRETLSLGHNFDPKGKISSNELCCFLQSLDVTELYRPHRPDTQLRSCLVDNLVRWCLAKLGYLYASRV